MPSMRTRPSFQNVQVIDIPEPVPGGRYRLSLKTQFDPNIDSTSWGHLTLPVSIVLVGAAPPPFEITNFERVSEQGDVFSLEWPGALGETYTVETSTDLINWTRATKPGGTQIADLVAEVTGQLRTVEVGVDSGNTRQFWRVKKTIAP